MPELSGACYHGADVWVSGDSLFGVGRSSSAEIGLLLCVPGKLPVCNVGFYALLCTHKCSSVNQSSAIGDTLCGCGGFCPCCVKCLNLLCCCCCFLCCATAIAWLCD